MHFQSKTRSQEQETVDLARDNHHVVALQYCAWLYVQELSFAMHSLNEITQVFVIALNLLNAFANEYRVGQEIGANRVFLIGGIHSRGLCLDPKLGIQRRGLLPQVNTEQFRRDDADEPDHAKGAEHVSKSVGDRDVIY